MKLNKKGVGEKNFPRPFFPSGKKGMEMWQLVLIILVLILLMAVLAWYGYLGGELKGFLGKLGELL